MNMINKNDEVNNVRYPINFQRPNFNINQPFNIQPNFNTKPNLSIQPNSKNLPDGIHFEPFNPKDLEKIKSSMQNKIDTSKIEKLIQNEHNGTIFYEHLGTLTNNENAINIIKKIKSNCMHSKNILNEIYESHSQNKFEIKNVQINKPTDFKHAINFAISQENESASDFLIFLDEASDISKKINFIFNQKLLNINYLYYIFIFG